MDKDNKVGTSLQSPSDEAFIKPNVEMTLSDLLVLSEELKHTNQGVDDGTDLNVVEDLSRYWRQHNFYISVRTAGKYIDTNEFAIGGAAGKPFLDSTYNGYRTRAYIWAPRSKEQGNKATINLWEDQFQTVTQDIVVSNGDPHAFCISYVTTVSFLSANWSEYNPFVVRFMVDSNIYYFTPHYFEPKTYKDIKNLSNSAENENIDVLNKLIVMNSRTPEMPPSRKRKYNNFLVRNKQNEEYLYVDQHPNYAPSETHLLRTSVYKSTKGSRFDFNIFSSPSFGPWYQTDCPLGATNKKSHFNLINTELGQLVCNQDNHYDFCQSIIDFQGERANFLVCQYPWSYDKGYPHYSMADAVFIPYWDINSFYIVCKFVLFSYTKNYDESEPITLYLASGTNLHPSDVSYVIFSRDYNKQFQDTFIWQFQDYDNG